METSYLPLLVGVAAGLTLLALGVTRLLRRRRREWRRLGQAGATAPGEVAAVEPMQRRVNGAAGQPVTVAFQDAGGTRRQARDESGLGGYLARSGTHAIVRYFPTHPGLVRVERLLGAHGMYPVRPDGGSPGWSRTVPILLVVGGLLIISGFGVPTLMAVGFEDEHAWLLPPLLLACAGAVLLIVSGVRRERPSEAQWDETVGVITDAWQEEYVGQFTDLWWTGHQDYRRPGRLHHFTVHFQAEDGREVHTRSRLPTARQPVAGTQVRVRYDPAHPVRFTVPEFVGERHTVPAAVFLGIGLVILGCLGAAVVSSVG